MPINTSGNHWCLIIADCKTRSFQYLDPLNLRNNGRCMQQFLGMLSKNKHSNHEIQDCTVSQSQPIDLPSQEDFLNCGPFVVLYAALRMGVFQLESNFDIYRFRYNIARKILEKCPPMTHLCLKCGKDEYRIKDDSVGVMINCDACHRWLHLRCVSANVSEEDDRFICELCTLWNPRVTDL